MIITGCQRSGTMSYAKLLGIRHEYYFNPCNRLLKGNEETSDKLLDREVPNNIFCESSWLSAPHVPLLLDNNQSVIRLVRHPMDVINSLMGIDFWQHEDHILYKDYIARYIDINTIHGKGGWKNTEEWLLHLSAQYYIQWHKLIPNDLPVIRIEDLINGPTLNHRNRCNYNIDSLATEDREELVELTLPWRYSMAPVIELQSV